MSLYNALFGKNEHSNFLLTVLDLSEADFCRFRDCYVSDNFIVVYTRLGGGNRDYYENVYEKMKKHPQFVRDEDDSFDCTYSSFFFKIPENRISEVQEFIGNDTAPQQKFKELIESLDDPSKKDDPQVQHALKVGKLILSPIISNGNTEVI